MKVLGIDPGTTLGWAYDAFSDESVPKWGTENFKLKRDESEGARWVKFKIWFQRMPRPDLLVFEQQNEFGRQAHQSAKIGILMASRIVEYCQEFGVSCVSVNPQTVKAFAIPAMPRAKKGEPKNPLLDRSKEAMILAAKRRIGRVGLELGEHEADALWMMWWGKHKYGGTLTIG